MASATQIRVSIVAAIVGIVGTLIALSIVNPSFGIDYTGGIDESNAASTAFSQPAPLVGDSTLATEGEAIPAASASAPTAGDASTASDGDPVDIAALRSESDSIPAAAPTAPTTAEPETPLTGYPATFDMASLAADTEIRSAPGGGEVIGSLPTRSKYLATRMKVWVREITPDGRFGKVSVPWVVNQRDGWVSLDGAAMSTTNVQIRVDISERRLRVIRDGAVAWGAPITVGAGHSPTPPGHYWVSDELATGNPGGPFGHYAFGLSGMQPNLPPGWTGGDQLAIHGTNAPGSIGKAQSAGCVRATYEVLERLKPLLDLGSPVVFTK